jgi:hypothetical protein
MHNYSLGSRCTYCMVGSILHRGRMQVLHGWYLVCTMQFLVCMGVLHDRYPSGMWFLVCRGVLHDIYLGTMWFLVCMSELHGHYPCKV